MTLVEGELWDELGVCDLLLVTTNAFVTRSGELVMGRGAAREARDRFPGLARELGQLLTRSQLAGGRYGLLFAPQRIEAIDGQPKSVRLGAFQVKWNWSDPADLDLVRYSTEKLKLIAERHPERRIAMNVPGTGNGRLPVAAVFPIIERLPDNVAVYHRGEFRD